MFSIKILNKLISFALASFFLFTFSFAFIDYKQQLENNLEFVSLLERVEAFNSENEEPLAGENQNNSPVETIKSGNEALLTSYSKLSNYNSYYSEMTGTLSTTTLGFPLSISISVKSIKYENGDFLQEIIAKEVGNTFGGQSGAIIYFYKKEDNLIYKNNAWSVTYIGNKVSPNYGKKWDAQLPADYYDSFHSYPWEPLYEIDNRTIVENTFFKVESDNYTSAPKYYTSHNLNPQLSTKKYLSFLSSALEIVEEDFVRAVNFQNLAVYAIIDENLNIISLRFKEQYNFTVSGFIGNVRVTVTSKCISEMTYIYNQINQNIDYPRPELPVLEE
jgi:hypothetical protein